MVNININFSNKWLYTLIIVGVVIAAGFLVNAYGTSDPVSFGHTPSEINPGIFAGGGDYVFPSGSMVKVSDAPVSSDDVVTKEYVDALDGGTAGTTSCYWDYSGNCATGFTSVKTGIYKFCYYINYNVDSHSLRYEYGYSLPPGASCGTYGSQRILGTAAFCCED